MSEEEIRQELAYKEGVAAELSSLRGEMVSGRYRQGLGGTDARLEAYALEVADHPAAHNVYELLAVRRYLRLLDGYAFRRERVRRFYRFYEALRFSGVRGRQRYRLTPVQCFQFAGIYGFAQPDGRRLTRTAYIFVPRKFSKTTSAAAMAVYDMLFGDGNAQAYVGANSYDQAKICFDEIRHIMMDLDPGGRHFRVNREKITFKDRGRDSLIQCLTANAKTKDGLFASLVIMDEFSQARDSELLTVLTTSMGVRENPLTVIITTASDVFDGPFYEMLQGYKSVLLGDYEDDSLFAHLFEPDLDDPEDAEATWRKVHPHLGVTVSLDFYRREYAGALRGGSEAMLAFRTKLLNTYADNGRRSWISSTLARHISRPINLDAIAGRPDAMVAIDLSESDDFSAVTVGMYDTARKSFYFHTAYFFPRGALPGHPNEKLYRVWADKGHLKLTDGDVIDYRRIVDYVTYLNSRVRILGIGYDPWKSQEVVNMLAASGAGRVIKGVRQTYGTFTAPVESFEHGAKTGHIFINDNPINAYCFGNAVLDTDRLENCKPIKRTATQKIDGVITTLMCLRLFIDYER